MGKIESTAIASAVRGKVGDLIFRQLYGKIVVSHHKSRRPRPRSREELAGVDRLRDATRRAKDAPADMVLRYNARAKLEQKPAFAVRMRDYMNPPKIDSVDLAGYRGAAGDPIVVRATDDFEVKEVSVTIRLPAGGMLESGVAQRGQEDCFHYVTTASAPAGGEVIVEVAASDWAKNVTTSAQRCFVSAHL